MISRHLAGVWTYAALWSVCGINAAEPPAPAPKDTPKTFVLSIDIYRAETDETDAATLRVAGMMSKSESRGDASNAGASSTSKARYSLTFREADITAKGLAFHAGPDGWTWNGKPEPPPGASVAKIAAPTVCALAGQPFEIFIGSEIPIQYFEKRPDGLFALKELKEWTGVRFKAAVEDGGDGQAVIRDLNFQVRTVGARAPLDGVTLDVGPPIVAARELVTTVKVPLDRCIGVIFDSEAQGFLLLKVKVSVAPPAEKRGAGAPPSSTEKPGAAPLPPATTRDSDARPGS